MNPKLRHAGRLAGPLLRAQSDERLVALAASGSTAAFEAIVGRYRKPLLRQCAGIVGDADAEEAVQDAFIRAHAALEAGTAVREVRPWLHVISRNAALNLRRSRVSRLDAPHAHSGELCAAPQAPPNDQREQLGEVVAAIHALPQRQRDAIVMHEMEGRSLNEIARHLGTSHGAVRQLLHRARTSIRHRLGAVTALDPLMRWLGDGGGATLGRVGILGGGCAATAKLCALALVPASLGGAGGAHGSAGSPSAQGHPASQIAAANPSGASGQLAQALIAQATTFSNPGRTTISAAVKFTPAAAGAGAAGSRATVSAADSGTGTPTSAASAIIWTAGGSAGASRDGSSDGAAPAQQPAAATARATACQPGCGSGGETGGSQQAVSRRPPSGDASQSSGDGASLTQAPATPGAGGRWSFSSGPRVQSDVVARPSQPGPGGAPGPRGG